MTDRLAAHGGVVLVLQEGRDEGGGVAEVQVAPPAGQGTGLASHVGIDLVRLIPQIYH